MPILPTRQKKGKLKAVNFFLPQELLAYLSLYSLAKGATRSFVLRHLLDDWYAEMRRDVPEDKLIGVIVDEASKKLAISKAQFKSFEEFTVELKRELKRKQIDPLSTKLIIKKIDEKNKERNDPNKQTGEG